MPEKIKKEDVEYVAALAHLEFDEAAKEKLARELDAILVYMDKLDELDTSGVEPMMHVSARPNVYRDDVVEPPMDHEAALKNAPKSDGNHFLVPRILDT